jgi:hypothetical protein
VRPGRHAAADGSFSRSAGNAAFRGAVLLAVAVLLGILLLQAADDDTSFDRPLRTSAGRVEETTTTTSRAPTGTSVRAPAQVKVIALNASGVAGVANKASQALARAGYQVLPAGNADKRATASYVYFTAGFTAEARQLAMGLGLATTTVLPLPSPPPAPSLEAADVVIVIGPDLASKLQAAAARTTTTTAR